MPENIRHAVRLVKSQPCATCNGTGRRQPKPSVGAMPDWLNSGDASCPHCSGQGHTETDELVDLADFHKLLAEVSARP